MKIVCIADTHGYHERLRIPGGDVLIHAGDLTEFGQTYEVRMAVDWLAAQPHLHKIFVAGNHDRCIEERNSQFRSQVASRPGVIYLQDSGITIDGVKFWGSPVQPWYYDWAFNRQRGAEIRAHWDLIPRDTKVLITHGPPRFILDENIKRQNQGCEELREVVLTKLPKLRLHVFGHIHPPGGHCAQIKRCRFVNAAQCDSRGYIQQRPVTVDLSL